MTPFDAAAQYWEARLGAHYDLQGVGFGELGLAYNTWLYRVRRTVFLRLIESLKIDIHELSVLDVGAGTGFYVELWNRLGARQVAGIDITSVAVENLEKRFPQNRFYRVDVSADLDLDEIYDVISAFDVLFHITDDQRFGSAIHNIFAALRPGGLFIFSDNFLHARPLRFQHQASRTLGWISQILLQTGFVIDQRTPMFSLMNAPVDSPSRLRQFAWKVQQRLIKLDEGMGFAIGCTLYPVELVLTRAKESATTEIMVCHKPNAAPA